MASPAIVMSNTTYNNFANWLLRVNQTDLPPKDIIAFNFGLFENANGYYTTYLTGSRNFDPKDDDWAGDMDYAPAEKYFDLREYRSTEKEWQEVLRDVVNLVKQFTKSPEFSASFLAEASAITVGFDDGELEHVK